MGSMNGPPGLSGTFFTGLHLRSQSSPAVICRQRPGTAKGFVFLTLEDETGLVNITVRPDLFETHGQVVVTSEVLEVGPTLPRLGTASRDFH
jgi:hypothetical protein